VIGTAPGSDVEVRFETVTVSVLLIAATSFEPPSMAYSGL
jgi:hypothetical protein